MIDNVTVHAVGGLTLKTVLANEKITRGNQIMKMMMTNSNPPTPYLINAFFFMPRGVG